MIRKLAAICKNNSFRKVGLALLTVTTLASVGLADATPAAADPYYGHYRGYGPGWGIGIGLPIFAPQPYYDQPTCVRRAHMVRDYYGWHRVWRRVCY